MKKLALVLCASAAVSLIGCKKKEEKKDTPAVKEPGPGTAKEPGPGTAAPPAPAPLTGAALGQAFVDHWSAWNAGDRAKFEGNYDANVAIQRDPMEGMPAPKGPAGIADEAFVMKGAFPDGKGTPQLVLVNGRTVIGVVHLGGTNSAPMKSPQGEAPPTGKKIGFSVLHAVTYNDANKIVEDRWMWDGNTFMSQIGMSPAPARAVTETPTAAPTVVVAASNDVEKANLAASLKGVEDFNKRDVPAMMAQWTDDAVESDQVAPADTTGKVEIEKGTKMFLGAFSDAKITPVTTLAAGDYIYQVSTFTGTNDGDMGDMKKTGKPLKMTVAEISMYQGGKVKQLWRFWDSTGMAMQLGLMPPPGAPPAGDKAAPPAAPAGDKAAPKTN